MKHSAITLALSLAFAANAWSQSPPNGTYQFISGAGTGYGTPPFTVTGGSLIGGGLGGFAGGIHIPNCSGFHVHGVFSGHADPNSGGCGHGIIALFGGAASVPGALSNLLASSAANQLALTRPGFSPYGFSPEQERMDLLALQQERGRQEARSFSLPRTDLPMFRNAVLSVVNAPSSARGSQASDSNRVSNEEPRITDVLKNLPPVVTTATSSVPNGSSALVTVADAKAARARATNAEIRSDTALAREIGASAEARQLADAAARARAIADENSRRSEAARREANTEKLLPSKSAIFSPEVLEAVAKGLEADAERTARAAADAAEAADFAAARAARIAADAKKAHASRAETAEAAIVAEAAAGDPQAIEDLKRMIEFRKPGNAEAAEAAFAAMLKAAPSNVTMAPTVDLSNVTVDLGDLVFKATSASAGMPRISN